MYIIYDSSNLEVMQCDREIAVATFLFGVIWGGGDPANFEVIKNGSPVLKTFIMNKYYPGEM